jgi:hypothetical protein
MAKAPLRSLSSEKNAPLSRAAFFIGLLVIKTPSHVADHHGKGAL